MFINLNLLVVVSLIYIEYGILEVEYLVFNVLDGIYGNDCKCVNVYSFVIEKNLWLEVVWFGIIIIWRIIIYNCYECCGK